jgi:hypothetical protein
MDNYYIKAILLEECSYSNAAFKIIKTHKLSDDIIWVNQSNKEKYKTEEINTFPQIYLNKINSNGNLLLGGYQELMNTINTFYKQKISEQTINNWMEQTKWSKKSTLRLIQLVNKIK